MRVLITGGAGFIGSNLVSALQNKADITILDNLRTGSLENLRGLKYKFIGGSITNKTAVSVAMRDIDYVFHLEDDWLFDKEFSLIESIDLMESETDVAYVGFSWDKKEFPEELFIPKLIGNFWEWYYSDKYELCEPLFIDTVEMKYLPNGHWVKYINWPYFSFRPGLHSIKKINKLENFNDKMDSFELEFSIRFADFYKSFFYAQSVCKHIGKDKSSYELNNSNR